MTKQTAKLFVAASVLVTSFFALNAFTKAPARNIVTGGGITSENVHFDISYLENASGTVGHFKLDGDLLNVECYEAQGNMATFYFNGGTQYITLVDNGEGLNAGDILTPLASVPVNPETGLLYTCDEVIPATAGYVISDGNIQVLKAEPSGLRRRIK